MSSHTSDKFFVGELFLRLQPQASFVANLIFSRLLMFDQNKNVK
jgi:hypothetical protein